MYSVVNAHVLSVFACMYVVLYFIVQFDVQTRRTHAHTYTHTHAYTHNTHTHTHTHTHRSLLSRLFGQAPPTKDGNAEKGAGEVTGAERRKKIKRRGSTRQAAYVFEVVHKDGVQYRKSPHFNARLYGRKWLCLCPCPCAL